MPGGRGMAAAPFRLLDTAPASGAFNMALDEALMASVRDGGLPVLRFYRWSPACLSLGRNQPAAGLYDRRELQRLGLDVVRRPTGGRAVLHARELTYSVVAAARWGGGARAAYRAINEALAAGLRRLGVAVAVQGEGGERAPAPSGEPCFRTPVAGEVVAGGRKLVGSAQLHEGGVMLQHGSLLLHDDQTLLARLGPAVRGTAGSLADHLDPLPAWTELTGALTAGWEEVFGRAPLPAEPGAAELRDARQLMKRHADPEWIWRR